MTVPDHQPWILRGDRPEQSPAVPAGVEYHRVYAGQSRRILRGVLAIVLLVAGFVGFAVLFQHLSEVVDAALFGRSGPSTPLRQAAGALALAALIPYCMLLQRVLYGVPAGSLHSVAGRFRFGVLGRTLLVFGPPVLVVVAVGALGGDGGSAPWTTADLVWFFVIGMVLTPLGAAGEEYGFRGLMFRVLGGWTRGARSGAILGIVVTTVLFSLIHGTLDPFLFTSYLVLFSSMAIVTWRTGGLEVAVVLHGVYNVSALVLGTTLHVDVGAELANRSAAVGSWANLVPSAVLVVITAIIWWATRSHGPTRTPENGWPTSGARGTGPHAKTLAGR
ncbi:CPBP family intramembrane glutamic endopeptidase [Pseudonocardia sp. KRD291]|uniref:CPBP family intramembrane glutamic endopeptidase n=1 Tax=Pseudonocardia sp. KRD291 TaxID=2792007 RepID=UPI001C49F8F9|nr:CPBP family intramembrane glutamic endopeptidase [Pseudonocardia sp. KRD291]MBW0100844.1 CPBP family intramembrane metalloprotease [Pseudonocardia sp. KRD291]